MLMLNLIPGYFLWCFRDEDPAALVTLACPHSQAAVERRSGKYVRAFSDLLMRCGSKAEVDPSVLLGHLGQTEGMVRMGKRAKF